MSPLRIAVPNWSSGISLSSYLLVGAAFVVLQGLVLLAMGQPPICECGHVTLWSGAVQGPETSQQLTDWYIYTHVVHGIAFYLILWFVVPNAPVGLRLALALGLEAGWEIFENTPFIINRYRESAIAQGYFGDSVINSLSDTLASAGGFVLARISPVWMIGVLVVATELFSAYMIHDNLVLNIIQLIHPSEAISNWQVGG